MKKKSVQNDKKRVAIASHNNPLVAIIDIGATAIRMVIAQQDIGGRCLVLESLQQPVGIGKDTFVYGSIGPATIEECVRVLRGFKSILSGYTGGGVCQIRAIATSAVREAANRDTFIDRILIATDIVIDVIDEEEMNRFLYHCVRFYHKDQKPLRDGMSLVVEVGGGTTQILLMEKCLITFSRSYRLGMFRLRETLEHHRTPNMRVRELIENQIRSTLERITVDIPVKPGTSIVIMGGDARFAANELIPDWNKTTLATLSVRKLLALDEKLLDMSPEEIVKKYHLSFFEAETVAPALLVYVLLAQAFKNESVYVTPYTVRDGVLLELYAHNKWTEDFAKQIVLSAMQLGKKFNFDRRHAERVAANSKWLFQRLQSEHQLPERYELILFIAAILHDIGTYIAMSNHHKHSYYLLLHSTLFGLGAADMELVALVARYHRRAAPSKEHVECKSLDRAERIIVTKLAALLRIADALDRSHRSHLRSFSGELVDGRFVISVDNTSDITMEQLALEEKSQLFRQMYGLEVVLQKRNGIGDTFHEEE